MVDSLIDDIQKHLETLEAALNSYSRSSDPTSKQDSLQRAQREITYIDPKLQQLDNSLKRAGDAEEYQDEVDSIKTDFRNFKTTYTRNNEEFQRTQSQAQAYQQGNQKLSGANEKLKSAINDGRETNDVLKQDLLTLEDDRRHLESIDSNVDEIDRQADTGIARAKRMLRRACFHKFIAWIIVVVLFAVLIIILWARFSKGGPLKCTKSKYKDTEECQKKN